jgi:hypothetical protein
MDRWMIDGWIDGWMMDEWMDGWAETEIVNTLHHQP